MNRRRTSDKVFWAGGIVIVVIYALLPVVWIVSLSLKPTCIFMASVARTFTEAASAVLGIANSITCAVRIDGDKTVRISIGSNTGIHRKVFRRAGRRTKGLIPGT